MGKGQEKGANLELCKRTLTKKVEEKLEGSWEKIKFRILIAITFDFMSYTYENIKHCLGSPSEVPLFSSL